MKISALFTFVFMALQVTADSIPQKIKFGLDLCENVSFTHDGREECNKRVYDDLNSLHPYQIALTICHEYNLGTSSREINCYSRASQWINSQTLRDRIDLCKARNTTTYSQSECANLAIVRLNAEAQTQLAAQTKTKK